MFYHDRSAYRRYCVLLFSIGRDSDTLAAITGGAAEAFYGVPADIRKHALTFLDERLLKILIDFERAYGF